jgi:ribosomal protein S18 acetylase RimI-like enzyme
MPRITVRPIAASDREWVRAFVEDRWGADHIVVHEDTYHPHALPGFIAEVDGRPAGLVTYHVDGPDCEIVTLDSTRPRIGVGSMLVDAVRAEAVRAGCRRLWLVTTNDNLHALGFYQRRGFRLVALHSNAVDVARHLKPSIPEIGRDDIPIHDEIELEMRLDNG